MVLKGREERGENQDASFGQALRGPLVPERTVVRFGNWRVALDALRGYECQWQAAGDAWLLATRAKFWQARSKGLSCSERGR